MRVNGKKVFRECNISTTFVSKGQIINRMHRSEFEKFVTAVRPRLIARARSIAGNSDQAEDIVQDCLLKLWTMRASLDDYNSPEALALTITHHLAINSLRSSTNNCPLNDEIISASLPSPEEKMISVEKGDEVQRVLAMLPDAQQALITMRHIEEMSISEIAAIVGSNEGAVRTALSRARLRVADIFTKLSKS